MSGTSSKPPAPAVLPPNQTLYISNLNDRIRKPDLRISLYTLFSTYGIVLDINTLLTMKCRGQAHVVFRDVASATQAMRALQGFEMFGKEMRVAYAKSKSHAISKLDGTFKLVAPGENGSGGAAGEKMPFVELPSAPVAAPAAAAGVKRQRDEESDEGEEMDVEEDDD